MSGEAFDCVEHRIHDIIERVEREIDRATCERPPIVVEERVRVREFRSDGRISYPCSWQNFRSAESAERYFRDVGYTVLNREDTEEGRQKVKMRDLVTGDVIEIWPYTDEHYAPDEDGEIPYFPDYTEETITEFRRGVKALKKAYIYAHRMAYLISGDDGEDSFHKRLNKELKELEETK